MLVVDASFPLGGIAGSNFAMGFAITAVSSMTVGALPVAIVAGVGILAGLLINKAVNAKISNGRSVKDIVKDVAKSFLKMKILDKVVNSLFGG